MKVFGIISKDIQTKKLRDCVWLMKRSPNEKLKMFIRDDSVIYTITHDKEHVSSTDFSVAVHDRNGEQFRYCEKNNSVKWIKHDLMGISKLYYYENPNVFVFSSEIKSIIAYVGRKNLTTNHSFIDQMIVYGFPMGDVTLFNEIKNLKPEHYIEMKHLTATIKDMIQVRQYVFEHRKKIDTTTLFQLLKDKTVPHELVEEESFVWLSGGLDSRILFKLLSDARPINHIVNFGFVGTKEREYAKKYVHKNDVVNLTTYAITPEFILENYKEHMWINEGFSGHLNAHIYGFMKKFKEMKNLVIYDGYAGDVIMGGNAYGKLSPRWEMKQYVNAPYFMYDGYWVPTEIEFHDEYMRNITASGGIKIGREVGTVIYPFAGFDFFKWCMQVPMKYRRKHKFYKKICRQSLPDVLKTKSTTLEAQSLFHRAKNKLAKKLGIYKQGYVQPNKWLRENDEYREEIYTTLFSDFDDRINPYKRDYFNEYKIKKIYKKHLRKEGDYGNILVRLFDLEVMFRQFLDGDKP